MEVGGGSSRRPWSLPDEKVDSPNLRDFLRVKQGDDSGRNSGSITLGDVLTQKRPSSVALANRTLFDIIRDDPTSSHSKKTWRTFKDKLRLRRAGAAWTSTVPIPASDIPLRNNNRTISRRNSTRFPTAANSDDLNSESSHPGPPPPEEMNRTILSSMPSSRGMMMRHNSSRMPSLSASSYGREAGISASSGTIQQAAEPNGEDEESSAGEAEEEGRQEGRETEESGEGGEPQVRTSLMALLAETDRIMGIDGSPFMIDDEDGEGEEEEGDEEMKPGSGEYNNCCVCMVRHKGAAFIPCGHTFCRLCSRELWVQRGNCPICNNFILEILDIF